MKEKEVLRENRRRERGDLKSKKDSNPIISSMIIIAERGLLFEENSLSHTFLLLFSSILQISSSSLGNVIGNGSCTWNYDDELLLLKSGIWPRVCYSCRSSWNATRTLDALWTFKRRLKITKLDPNWGENFQKNPKKLMIKTRWRRKVLSFSVLFQLLMVAIKEGKIWRHNFLYNSHFRMHLQ